MRNAARQLKQAVGDLLYAHSEKRRSMGGPAHLWRMKRAYQIEYLKQVGLKREHYLLDIGCGSLRGGIPIIEYLAKRHYYGIEVRARVLDEGIEELRDTKLEHKEPVLVLVQDFSSTIIEVEFDFIWAFSVLIHLEDDPLRNCLSFVHKHLIASGSFYANVNMGGRKEAGHWQGFPTVSRSLEFYKELAAHAGLQVSDMGALSSLGHESGIAAQDEQRMLRFVKT